MKKGYKSHVNEGLLKAPHFVSEMIYNVIVSDENI